MLKSLFSSRPSLQLQILYWVGLLLIIAVTFAEPFTGLASTTFGPTWTSYLLIWSLSHVVLMALIGFQVRRHEDRSHTVHAGNQVQTAGYLHTLIGFGAALLVFDAGSNVGPGSLELTRVLYPIGSALSTSILGWFLGGEIIGRDPTIETDAAVRRQLIDLLADLESFTETARTRHQKYLDTLGEIVKTQEAALSTQKEMKLTQADLHDTQRTLLSEATEMSERVNTSLKRLRDTSETLESSLDETAATLMSSVASEGFQNALEAMSQSVRILSKSLKNTRGYAQSIEWDIDQAGTHAETLRESLQSFQESATDAHDDYLNNIRTAGAAVTEVGKEINNLLHRVREDAETLTRLPEILAPIESTAADLKGLLNSIKIAVTDVETATNSVERSLHGVTKSGGRLEESLETTTSTAKRMTNAIRQTRDIIDQMIEERYQSNSQPKGNRPQGNR